MFVSFAPTAGRWPPTAVFSKFMPSDESDDESLESLESLEPSESEDPLDAPSAADPVVHPFTSSSDGLDVLPESLFGALWVMRFRFAETGGSPPSSPLLLSSESELPSESVPEDEVEPESSELEASPEPSFDVSSEDSELGDF